MRLVLCFLFALPVSANWNSYVLSGATEGTFVSRLVQVGGVFQERTYIAHRDAGGMLAITRFNGTTFTTKAVWAVTPSLPFAGLNPSGVLLVTFWSNNRYRFAMSVANSSGNCGPAGEYYCGTVPLPAGHTATAMERIVGEVASNGTAHFVYALRSTAFNGQSLYSKSRTAAGVWSTPVRMQFIAEPLLSPVNFSYGASQPGVTPDGWVTGMGPYQPHLIQVAPQVDYSIPAPWLTTFVNSERRPLSRVHCLVRGVPGEPKGIRAQHRNSANAQVSIDAVVFLPSAELSATNWCDIAVNGTDTAAVIAFADTAGAVILARSPVRGGWESTQWNLEVIDSSSVYSQPQVAYRLTGRFLVGYQGPGYFKVLAQL